MTGGEGRKRRGPQELLLLSSLLIDIPSDCVLCSGYSIFAPDSRRDFIFSFKNALAIFILDL
jgi:hypothetical protein